MKVLLLALCLMTTSCVQNVEQFSMRTAFFSAAVENECEEIKSTGDIFELLGLIRTDTKNVLSLLDRPSKGVEEKISVLGERVDVNASKVIRLSKLEWNEPVLRHSITWKLNDTNFGSRNRYVYDPKVKSVYFLGKEHAELIPRVRVTQNGNEFVIEYLNMSTYLEYCQLNETLMIVLEIKQDSFGRPKNLYFNLNVNLEK